MAKMDTLKDDFSGSAIDTAKWPDVAGDVTVESGRAKINKTTNTAPGLSTWVGYDFKGSSIYAKITPRMTDDLISFRFYLFDRTSTHYDSYQFTISKDVAGGQSTPMLTIQGVDNNATFVGTSITYDPVAHAWLRISESGPGLVNYDTSPDGRTWTNRFGHLQPHATLSLGVQLIHVYPVGKPGDSIVYVDNVNTPGANGNFMAFFM
jgi:hypothetical protein